MKNFFNPASNTKTIGFILILLGIVGIITKLPYVLTPMATQLLFLGLLQDIFYLVTGFGLRKLKLWGLYCFLASVLISDVSMFIFKQFDSFTIIVNVIFTLIIVWLFSAKKIFTK